MNELEKEKVHLEEILEIINFYLKEDTKSLDDLLGKYRRDPMKYSTSLNILKTKIENYKKSLTSPYFARIDYKELENKTTPEQIYIGKHSLMSDKNEPLIVDWRAPISSLYYDSDLGKTYYISPIGKIDVELLLKRQYEIENGILKSFQDVDLVSKDSLLQKYLNENNNTRIKNIVSTIQKEQNKVIREPLHKNIILQGVAGSGKTTVALHRIAYLVYTYSSEIKEGDFLILGPNNVFLKYIESVLPDLDVFGVLESSLENYYLNFIGENLTLEKSNNTPSQKTTLDFLNQLDTFINNYIKELISTDLTLNDFVVLTKEEIIDCFKKNFSENKSLNIIIEGTQNLITKKIEDNLENYLLKYTEYTYTTYKNVTSKEELEKLKIEIQKNRKELEKGCRQTLKKYFKKSNTTPLKLYMEFISTLEDKDLKNTTLKNLKKKKVEYADLALISYIKQRLLNTQTNKLPSHIVIDEAQDLSVVDYKVLKYINNTSSFSIFGDIAQSIYSYRSINSWKEVESVFEGNINMLYLLESYRSTKEIMSLASNILELIGIPLPKETLREGEDVVIEEISAKDSPKYIKDKINELLKKGYKTIAVISKTEEESIKITNELNCLGVKINNVTESSDINSLDYLICTITGCLAKGLEFDAVILNGVTKENYQINNIQDMKLLYVSITRALHELIITYDGEPSVILKNAYSKKLIPQK